MILEKHLNILASLYSQLYPIHGIDLFSNDQLQIRTTISDTAQDQAYQRRTRLEMCCGNLPAAPESADLMAVIHPCAHNFAGKLRISNPCANTTISSFLHTNGENVFEQGLTVRVHRYGLPIDTNMANPVMHTFNVEGPSLTSSIARIDLGVGETGIIGRTVSIIAMDGVLLGQGIVGRI